ncbi:methylenetetrahydrofolate reductase [Pseudonocardia sp. TRM90224]|uniref:methylenetetrahydrofolate reductase n=1 Tax=Pseudonocardia sp. TRM90224 TaxID=2812678 RepID=UPI001E3F74CD|nr:methylenetetrahydrofolate reductase [Pseudonocardia sp. TRM90224]
MEEQLADVPRSTGLTITCSPRWGIDRTLEYTEVATAAGFAVVPHLAARQIVDEPDLRRIVRRLDALGVRGIFVIGGDAPQVAGRYSSAGELLDELAGIDHPFGSIGVACYPEGHPSVADDRLADALRRKQRHAAYMVSQLCFDASTITRWLEGVRRAEITLPLRAGVAGPLDTAALTELSVRIGVGPSLRYLRKQHGMVSTLLGTLVRRDAHRPEALVAGLAARAEELGIERIHLNSFNRVAATVAWQRRLLA